MARHKVPSLDDLKRKINEIVRSRKQNVKDVEREIRKLYEDYFRRVRDMLTKDLSSTEKLNLQATTQMMRDIGGLIEDAGKDDLLRKYRSKFSGLADDALSYFDAFGLSAATGGVSREAIAAYSKFAETELAKSIDSRLVGPIQSALLQANYGSYTRAELITQVQAIEPTITTTNATVLVDDAFSQFQRAIIVEKGDDAELEIYQYLGPDDDITSPQCDAMLHVDTHGAEGILYKDEITIELHENLTANPLIAGGHPRCRHQWTPVTLEYAMEQGFEPR